MKWIPAPAFDTINELKYREHYAGLPTLMRIFMYCSRQSAFFIIVLIIFALHLNEFVVILLPFYSFEATRIDFFRKLGFYMFKGLITQ